jgi:hypothetical protein
MRRYAFFVHLVEALEAFDKYGGWSATFRDAQGSRRRSGVPSSRSCAGVGWGGYQRWLVALTALTIVIDGIDNQLMGVAIPTIMGERRRAARRRQKATGFSFRLAERDRAAPHRG